jgi:acetate kinase
MKPADPCILTINGGSRNADRAGVISTDASRTTVRVIPTDEDLMMRARCTAFSRPARGTQRTEP